MGNVIRRWCAFGALLVAGGCTSLEDFQAMSPDARADKVCGATLAARERRRTLSGLDAEIAEREDLLATGYRVHNYCRVVAVMVPAQAPDCSGLSGDELSACQRRTVPAHAENRRVCEPVAVPIDYPYESARLRDLQLTRAEQRDADEEQRAGCFSRARELSADDAWSRYKANAEP